MEIYETISELRKNKGQSIKDITSNNISKSSYNRYINGFSDIHSKSFIELLHRLHITLSELEYINNGYTPNNEVVFMRKIISSFKKNDLPYLKHLQKTCKVNCDKNDFYMHMLGLCELLIARTNKIEPDINNNCLYKYLISTNTWTNYEFLLFSNSLFYWSPITLDAILTSVSSRLSNLDSLNSYGLESVRILSNAIISFIYHREYGKALKYIDTLESIYISEEFVFEKLTLKFMQGIKLKLLNYPSEYYSNIFENILLVLDILELNDIKKMYVTIINDFINK